MFADRIAAGRQLAARLLPLREEHPVVLGMPRGGVPVAFEVARLLQAPLDVVLVRKLGTPHRPELAMGAVGERGVVVVNEDVMRHAGVSDAEFSAARDQERGVLNRRAQQLRRDRARIPVAGRTVILVDDGIATGATARAACQATRAAGAARLVLAVPVAASDAVRALRAVADEVVCLEEPVDFVAVGRWYRDFAAVSDEEVVRLLGRAARAHRFAARRGRLASEQDITLHIGHATLGGKLTLPTSTSMTVVFAHGSGSSRLSPRNAAVARILQGAGLGTLLLDLLTADEGRDRANVFDIPLLAGRVHATAEWLRSAGLGIEQIAYFGASTGAAAALWAAAEPHADIAAVVSRGGRPDLALPRLAAVTAPTLLIVGGRDVQVLELNRTALAHLHGEARLVVVPGAGHLFEEPGTLESVANLTSDWFLTHHGLSPVTR